MDVMPSHSASELLQIGFVYLHCDVPRLYPLDQMQQCRMRCYAGATRWT